jgi:sugar phosphate isomerase/epimerase
MKYAIVASVSQTNFGEIAFKEGLESTIHKAKEMRFDGVELSVKSSGTLDVGKTKELLDSLDLVVPAIGSGQLYIDEGLSFADEDTKIRSKAVEKFKDLIDVAEAFDARIIIGFIAGNMKNYNSGSLDQKKEALKRICGCIQDSLEYGSRSVKVLIEPLHRFNTNIFNTIHDVISFIDLNFHDEEKARVGVLADTWHMNIEEASITQAVSDNYDRIKHVHFADSNRRAPGMGHFDFQEIISVLLKKRYEGFISFEMLPFPDPIRAAQAALKYSKAIEHRLTGR